MENKWIVMLTVVVASLIGSINMSIMLIALPAIFNGIQINPLNSFQYLLWMIMGYSLLTATLLLSFGRLSDIHGRVKMFRLGFLIFTAASVLLSLTPSTGDAGALEIIAFRMIQAVGAALFMANSAAILTDVFPTNELGKALGINTVAVMSGSFIGLVLGGILAILNWRYVFLVSVPFGVIGTFLSYYKLKEVSIKSVKTKIDIWGNSTFILGITLLLIGITYGLLPYGSDPMGWSNPWVIISMILGVLALISFPLVEQRVEDPMFRFDLFKIRMFRYGNLAGLLSALGRGGMMFLLIILLQGIWLPLHGYSYESTPFWAGIYILPLTIGMSIMGPISGILSDKYGSRLIATTGMVVCTITFILLAALPYNFNFWEFGLLVFFMGVGNGIFGSPNNASIMKSVPPNERGVASGMIYTLMNTGFTVSMGLFFTVLIVGITQRFPAEMTSSLVSIGASNLAPLLNNIPATSALFSAILGYNPIGSILASLPAPAVASIPPATLSTLTSTTWFPTTFATAFMPSLQISFYMGALLTGTAAVLSALRGDKYSHENEGVTVENLEKSKGK
jgi:MFS family permease